MPSNSLPFQALMIIQLNMLNTAVPNPGLLAREFLKGLPAPNCPFKDPKCKSARGGRIPKQQRCSLIRYHLLSEASTEQQD